MARLLWGGSGLARGWDCGVGLGQPLLCVNSLKDKPKWTELLWVHVRDMVLGIAGRCGMVCRMHFPQGLRGCVALMGGGTCLEIGLAVVPSRGLIGCLLLESYTAALVYGRRALPSSPRVLYGRYPRVDCVVRNSERVDCSVNRVSLASSPRCLGN